MFARRSFAILTSLVLLATVGCGGTANSVPSGALKMIPADALAGIIIKDVSKTDALITKIASVTNLPLPGSLLSLLKDAGIKEGLDEKGSIVVAVIAGANGPPQFFLCTPVTNYKKFIDQLEPTDAGNGVSKIKIRGTGNVVTSKGNYAVLTPGDNAAALTAFVNAKTDISSALTPISSWLGEQDVAAFATSAGIKLGVGPARDGLKNAKRSFPADNPQSAQVLAAFQIYEKLFDLLEGELDQAGFGFRGDDKTNLHFTSRWQFKSGSSTAKALADIKAASGKAFSDLPNSPFVFAGAGVLPKNFMESYMKLIANMLPAESLSQEDLAKFEASVKLSMDGMQHMSMSLGIPKPNEGIYGEMISVIQMEDTEKFIANAEKSFATMNELLAKMKIPNMPSYDVKATTVNNLKAIELAMDMRASLPPGDEKMHAMFEKLFGKDGKLQFTYVALDKKTVLTVYGGADLAASKVTAYRDRKGSLADNTQLASTIALLAKDSQWVGAWDIGGTVALVKQMIASFGPDAPPMAIPDFPACPPLGFSARANNNGLETDLAVHADTLKAVSTVAKDLATKKLGESADAP